MGNVGGRSKGCSTCRKRRVKCDEARPVCNRCQRWGWECDIGGRDITFIQGTIVKSRHRAVTSGTRDVECVPQHSGTDPQIPLIPGLCENMKFEIAICYSMKHLGRGRAIDLQLQKHQLGDIITAGTSATTANSQVFPKAILSYAFIVFGIEQSEAHATKRGYTLLGGALKQLNAALSNSACHVDDDVIISVATLAILECLVPTGANHYLQHMLGIERLLELRDPGKHCSQSSVEVYKSVRHMAIFASLRTGRASVLARPEWKAVLRRGCTKQEMLEQDLFDVLADVTVLSAERNKMLATRDVERDVKKKHDTMLHGAQSLHGYLLDWKDRWDADHGHSYSKVSSTRDGNLSSSTIYAFSGEYTAVMLMLYNTTLIYILQLLATLPFLPSTKRDQYNAMARIAAIEICRCIPFYTQTGTAHEHPRSSPVTHWAVATAWTTLCGNELSVEDRMMMELLNVKGRQVTARAIMPD